MVVVEVVDVGGSHLVESPFFLNCFSRGETSVRKVVLVVLDVVVVGRYVGRMYLTVLVVVKTVDSEG